MDLHGVPAGDVGDEFLHELMGTFCRFECDACGHVIAERTFLEDKDKDGRPCRRDEAFCPVCREMRTTFYPDTFTEDPELWKVRSGNVGKILEFLVERGPIALDGSQEAKDWIHGLPPAGNLQRWGDRLISAGLAEKSGVLLQLTAQGRDRLRKSELRGNCPICAHPLPSREPVRPCPKCKTGSMGPTMIGRTG